MGLLILRSSVTGADTTAPTLTSAVGTETGATSATVGATTDEGNGTLYVVVTTSATQPSVAQIKAGDDHTGANATYASSQAISSTGAKTFSATGLTASTTYYAHLVHTDAAANDSNRISSTSFTTDAASGTVIFNPGALGAYATPADIFTEDVNRYGPGDASTYAVVTLQSTVTRPGGSSKAIQIVYPNDEAGAEMYFAPSFTATPTLYVRWRMMLGAEWQNNWPVGLKTTRWFTPGLAYHSAKMIWAKYANGTGFAPDGPGDGSLDYPWGCCSAAYNLDVGAKYEASTLFANGLPYLRAGVWYLYEIYHEINSGDGVADGKLQMRIDSQPVYTNNAFKWVDSARGAVGGLDGFERGWFGGNISAADGFTSSVALNRYEDDYFVSTDAQWL